MPTAIALIVDGFVSLGDKEALQRLRDHRQQMLGDVQALSGLDVTRTVTELEHELEVIDSGLSDLANPRHSGL